MGNDRYAYVNNSPLIHTDPTGHYEEGDCTTTGSSCGSPQSTSSSVSAYTPSDPPHTRLATVSYALNAAAAFVDGIGTGLELSIGGAGNAIFRISLNPLETVWSGVSTLATIFDDIAVDGRLDCEASYISLGASIAGTFSQSATIDLIIDTYVAGYSAGAFKGIISGENAQRDPKVEWLFSEQEQQEQYIPIITKDHKK